MAAKVAADASMLSQSSAHSGVDFMLAKHLVDVNKEKDLKIKQQEEEIKMLREEIEFRKKQEDELRRSA